MSRVVYTWLKCPRFLNGQARKTCLVLRRNVMVENQDHNNKRLNLNLRNRGEKIGKIDRNGQIDEINKLNS